MAVVELQGKQKIPKIYGPSPLKAACLSRMHAYSPGRIWYLAYGSRAAGGTQQLWLGRAFQHRNYGGALHGTRLSSPVKTPMTPCLEEPLTLNHPS